MSSNPYQSPAPSPLGGQLPPREAALQVLSAPATGLIVVAAISVVLLIPSLMFDLYLLGNGADDPGRLLVRAAWGTAILAASGYALWGGLQMKKLQQYEQVRRAAIIASIPCLGPCCLLGIPFGIWSLTVLNRPEVRSQFES